MKRFLSLLCSLMFLIPTATKAVAEDEKLVIAILDYKSNAFNFSIEEAFFQQHPNATIEYHLYSTEQFNSILMNGQADFDLAIVTYSMLRTMLSKGYTQTLDTIGLTEYPEQFIDLSRLLMVDGKLISLPLWEVQNCYFWDSGLARKAGVSNPATKGYWTWEEFAELCRQLPKDTDGDGEPDIYLMYGEALRDCPYLQNVSVEMFVDFLYPHAEQIDAFFTDYFDLFREIFISDAYLPMDTKGQQKQVIITFCGGINPIDRAGNLIPLPIFSEEEDYQFGGVTSVALMQNAPHQELAADFLRAMLSDEALSLYAGLPGDYSRMMAKKAPTKVVSNVEMLRPVFSDVNGISTAYVTAGRRYFTGYFQAGQYSKAQRFREKLYASTFPGKSDFHCAVWNYLQEWYLGHISDEELKESVEYLVNMTIGE